MMNWLEQAHALEIFDQQTWETEPKLAPTAAVVSRAAAMAHKFIGESLSEDLAAAI